MIYTIVDGKLVPYLNKSGKRYKHRSKEQQRHNTVRAKRKNKYYKNFYNTYRWHRLSYQYRKQHALCEVCLSRYHAGKIPLEKVNIATEVDHIVKLSDDWSKRFDRSNLQAICHQHHIEKDGNAF